VNYDNSLVVTITVTCCSWAPSSGDHLFTCGAIYRLPHFLFDIEVKEGKSSASQQNEKITFGTRVMLEMLEFKKQVLSHKVYFNNFHI